MPDSPTLYLTPEGTLHLDSESNTKLIVRLRDATTPGTLLLILASDAADGALDEDLTFWRSMAREFITRLCHLPGIKDGAWRAGPALPSEPEIEALIQSAPPVLGMEYLVPSVIAALWQNMVEAIAGEASKHGDDIEAVLRELHPVWRTVGRVTLHLAENKRDNERPFAFLATYVHRLNARAEAEHLPLARALKDHAADHAMLRSLLAPLQAASEKSSVIRELIASKKVFAAAAWSPEQAFEFLKDIPVLEDSGLLVKVPDWWQSKRPPTANVTLTLDSGEDHSKLGANALLGFNINIAVGDDALTKAEIEAIMTSTAPLISLKGKWIEPDREKLKQALNFWNRAASANKDGVPFHEGLRWMAGFAGGMGGRADAEAAAMMAMSKVTAGPNLAAMLGQMRSETMGDAAKLPAALTATLRHYQKEGLDWLSFMTRAGLGACLADDMGLGKTLQLIALLARRAEERIATKQAPKPSLIVAPASLLANWRSEIERWAPTMKLLIAHRSAVDNDAMIALAAGSHAALVRDTIVITTYTTLAKLTSFEKIAWDVLALDEAQAIKNAGSGQAKTVKALKPVARIALTGTPVENRLGDLWSLFDFLNPGLLGSATGFANHARTLAKSGGYGSLRRLVRPFILRRMKTDPKVAPDLPRKTEMIAYCELSKKQSQLYLKAVTLLKKELKEAEEGIKRQGVVLGALMRLKQICNHPSQWSGDKTFAPADSGKFSRLEELCSAIADRQEKVLVFTQFREMTDPIADYLAKVFGRPGLVLHGGTPVGKRGELVERFQSPDGPPFFVISVKAGGTGLTLTAASQVIHFDRWWNPAVEDQATDRAFRIGQTKPVLVHKFVCQGTLEERIDKLIRDKKKLSRDVLGDDDGSAAQLLTHMSDSELLDFVSLSGEWVGE